MKLRVLLINRDSYIVKLCVFSGSASGLSHVQQSRLVPAIAVLKMSILQLPPMTEIYVESTAYTIINIII